MVPPREPSGSILATQRKDYKPEADIGGVFADLVDPEPPLPGGGMEVEVNFISKEFHVLVQALLPPVRGHPSPRAQLRKTQPVPGCAIKKTIVYSMTYCGQDKHQPQGHEGPNHRDQEQRLPSTHQARSPTLSPVSHGRRSPTESSSAKLAARQHRPSAVVQPQTRARPQ